MPVTKPRVVAGTIRPASRDTYDMRKAVALPSATGGAPPQGGGVLAAAVGEDVGLSPEAAPLKIAGPNPADVAMVKQMAQDGQLRYGQGGVIPRLTTFNRSLEDYTKNNEPIVQETRTYLDSMQTQGVDVLQGVFADTDEMARWAVAHIVRSFEPGPVPQVPDYIHQSREGRRVMQMSAYLKGAQNAGA